MKTHTLLFLIATAATFAACDRVSPLQIGNKTQSSQFQVQDAYDRQLKKAEQQAQQAEEMMKRQFEHLDIAARDLKRQSEYLDASEKQLKRLDALQEKWDEEAKRYVAILTRWEQQPAQAALGKPQ